MASKKLARQTSIIGGGKHGRRRARPHIARAANRDFRWGILAAILALAVIGLLVFGSGTARNPETRRVSYLLLLSSTSPCTGLSISI